MAAGALAGRDGVPLSSAVPRDDELIQPERRSFIEFCGLSENRNLVISNANRRNAPLVQVLDNSGRLSQWV